MDVQKLLVTHVRTLTNTDVLFADLLTQPLNVFHVQDSCGSGRTCKIITHSIETHLADLTKIASVTILFADDAFDREQPPESSVQRVGVSKHNLQDLGLLDAEGYVNRVTLILNNKGDLLKTLPVTTEQELASHVEDVILPELQKLYDQT